MKLEKKLEKKGFGFGKKKFGSDTDTEIGPWFRSYTTGHYAIFVNIGFPNGLIENVFIPSIEKISIPDNHGPFGNCVPVRVNQAIFSVFAVI